MAKMASFQCGTQRRMEKFTRPYSASNAIYATLRECTARSYMERILR